MLFARFACLAGLVGAAIAATPAQWRTQSIYFLLTDRFARSDGSTDAECDAGMGRYCGGTWKGIIDKLDYIQGMGFTAIWITPVTDQVPKNTSIGAAYHGYWQQDIYSLDEHLGTADDLKELAQALHDRNMYLMVDVVANHLGYADDSGKVDYSVFNPFNDKKYFHDPCPIDNYDDPNNFHNCWLAEKTVSLPDLNTERKDVKDMWYDWVGSLVSNYSIDGLRIDTVKHVQKDFWSEFNKAAGVYCVGEIFDADTKSVCSYQKVMDGVLNYPLYHPLVKAFKSPKGSMSDLYDKISDVKSSCSDSTLMGTFAENHDNPRFASYTDDISLAKNAAAFTIMADGIPIIYAGQEQHYAGGKNPTNREALWPSGYNTKSELYQLIGKANSIRNQAIYRNKEYITNKTRPIYKDDNTLAMRKGKDGSQTVTIVSNLGSNGKEYTLSLPNTGFRSGTSLTEIITCSTIKVDGDDKVPVPMKGGEPRIVYPSSELEGAKLCS